LSLGARCKGRTIPGSVNLLQQSPVDKPLGDVLIKYPGVMRLMEFKRSTNRSGKEPQKFATLNAALSSPKLAHLVPVSRSVHWFVASTKLGKPFAARAKPYLDYGQATPESQTTLAAFTDALVDEALAPTRRFTPEVLASYLKCVADWQGPNDASSSGVLVALDQTGQLRYASLDDIRDLRMTDRQMIDMQMANENAYALGHAKELERQRGLERGQDQSSGPEQSSGHGQSL